MILAPDARVFDRTISVIERALAVHLIVLEFADVFLAVGVRKGALPIIIAVFEFPYVLFAVL